MRCKDKEAQLLHVAVLDHTIGPVMGWSYIVGVFDHILGRRYSLS